jgi:WD40 repeat protein
MGLTFRFNSNIPSNCSISAATEPDVSIQRCVAWRPTLRYPHSRYQSNLCPLHRYRIQRHAPIHASLVSPGSTYSQTGNHYHINWQCDDLPVGSLQPFLPIMSRPVLHTRKDFLKDYSFPTTPARDFERNGIPAAFASGHPKPENWFSTNEAFDYDQFMKQDGQCLHRSYHSALSSDQKLLAISSNRERIVIYDVATKELRAVLEGSDRVAFKPVQSPAQGTGYTLISSISDLEARGAVSNNRLILWDLDQHGRLLDEEEPIDTADFASLAINAILPKLTSDHEWSKDFAQASSLHADFEKALSRAAADHRRRQHTILSNAQIGSFSSSPFSDDGRFLLYHGENGSTQRGMRDADKLPHVVVYDVDAGKEVHRLYGHTDAIMWSAMSPDYQLVASVSWDGTMRMYSTDTGYLQWVTEDSGSQSWAGAFTPDSKHVIWSSKSGRTIKVHDVSDGREVCAFADEPDDWCRYFAWNATGDKVAFAGRKHAYVWCPFDSPHGTIDQHFVLEEDKDWRLSSISSIGWMKDGEILALEFSDGTKLIYNTQTNSKELFVKPQGVNTAWVDQGLYGILGGGPEQPDFYLTVDGDGKVRYCPTSVPAGPSWWEKEPGKKKLVESAKKMYPETGKYVKVTKVSRKEAPKNDDEGASWVDQGAVIWTAE